MRLNDRTSLDTIFLAISLLVQSCSFLFILSHTYGYIHDPTTDNLWKQCATQRVSGRTSVCLLCEKVIKKFARLLGEKCMNFKTNNIGNTMFMNHTYLLQPVSLCVCMCAHAFSARLIHPLRCDSTAINDFHSLYIPLKLLISVVLFHF